MFNLSPFTLLFLVLLALFIFGPDKLPNAVAQGARAVRRLRSALRTASEGIRDELGPEFRDLELSDLTPRGFVRKHLLADEPAPAMPAFTLPEVAPRPAPEGWPANVPYPSAEEMGLGPDDDPFTAPIPADRFPRPTAAAEGEPHHPKE